MIELDSIISVCAEDHARVERLLRENTASVVPLIPQVGAHTFGSGGKRLRPLLVVLTARLCGYRGPRAAQVAAAVEFFHSASLLHDDVVDGASLRRGQPSANARYGERMAVLVGDFMYARACQMLVDDGSIEILSLYAEALRQMTEGEVLQLSRSDKEDLSKQELDADVQMLGGLVRMEIACDLPIHTGIRQRLYFTFGVAYQWGLAEARLRLRDKTGGSPRIREESRIRLDAFSAFIGLTARF